MNEITEEIQRNGLNAYEDGDNVKFNCPNCETTSHVVRKYISRHGIKSETLVCLKCFGHTKSWAVF